MLKITEHQCDKDKKLLVEGRLAGESVPELTRSWQALAGRGGDGPLAVDLSGVTFIDAAGRELLAAMHAQGVLFIASGCATRRLLSEITGAAPPAS